MFNRKDADRQLDAELRAFVELLTEEKVRAGLPRPEARRAALLETGGIEQVKEQVRAERPGVWLEGLLQDARYALRKIRREPGFFVFAAMIIALGVGANTAVYSVMNPLLLRPLPFEQPERLVWIAQSTGEGLSAKTSRSSNLRDYRVTNRAFEALTGYFAFFEYESYTLQADGQPQRLVGVGVARNFLDVLGVRPQLGRNFVDEEAVWGGRPAAILTHAFWSRRFNADPGIVGRAIPLNGTPTEIVGVLPASFDFASTFAPASRVDFLRPFPISDETDRWGNTLSIIGRLKPGATVESAQADLDRINRQLLAAEPDRWGLGAVVSSVRDHIAGSFRTPLLLLIAAAGVVLLVACANLSNLMLARVRRRGKEMAVRSALGADRTRLVRQLTIESLILALCGGVIGVLLAAALTHVVAGAGATAIPLLDTISIDLGALLFTLVITLLAGVVVGIAPVLQLPRGREARTINDSSRGSTEGKRATVVREILVMSEVALACVLLVAGGLLLRSFTRVLDVELGFQPRGAYAWRVDTDRRFETREEAVAFYEGLIAAVEVVPGVDGVGLTDTPPLGRNRAWGIRAEGTSDDEDQIPVFPRVVDSRYLETMRIPLMSGRHFTTHDDGGSEPVVIINETAARALFRGAEAVGRTVLISSGRPERRVIGVVSDVRHQSLEAESGLEMYLPLTQSPDYSGLTMIVRSRLPLASVAPGVRSALASVDPAMPTGDYQTFTSVIERAVSPRRFILFVIGGFAGTAVLLAALGIYAVVSYSVSQRTPEIGIRMALGASAGGIQRSIVRRTLLLAGAGIATGAVLSLVASRLMQSLLYGIPPTDRLTFVSMTVVLLLVAMVAGYLPARRASRVDPLMALRMAP